MYETHQKRASRSPIDTGINDRPTWPPRANRTQPMTAPNSATRASAPSTSWVSTDAVVERPFENCGSAPSTIPITTTAAIAARTTPITAATCLRIARIDIADLLYGGKSHLTD